jgi:Bifunctional DNA primase/polymerase, N-terminal
MNTAAWAERYLERFGFKLVPLHGKTPIRAGWQLDENLLCSPGAAREYFGRNPRDNMGACLEPSRLVSVDADHPEGAQLVLAAEGIDLDALIVATPTIIGRAPRLEFRAPHPPLGRKAIAWPPRAAGEKPVTVLELRAGRVQDVLPPSIHPDTKQPYRWITPPRDGFPPLPESLLRLWQNFDAFKHRARNLCPWADPEPEPAPQPPRRIQARTGPSVIAAFNDAHDVVAILESHGYQREGKRWKSPNGHNLAGVVVLPSGKVYCHHTSDPLGDEKAHDAFDLFRVFDHGGDYRAAVKAAAQALGLGRCAC